MFCSNCKKEIKDGSTFCYFCGAKIEEIEQERFCPKCGAKLDSDSVFCNVCGAKIEVSPNRDDSSFVTIDIDKTKQKIGTFGNEAKNVINTTAGKISDSAKENVKISSSKIAISKKAIAFFVAIVIIILAGFILFNKIGNNRISPFSKSSSAILDGTYKVDGEGNFSSLTFNKDGTLIINGSIEGLYFLSDKTLYIKGSNEGVYYEIDLIDDYLILKVPENGGTFYSESYAQFYKKKA